MSKLTELEKQYNATAERLSIVIAELVEKKEGISNTKHSKSDIKELRYIILKLQHKLSVILHEIDDITNDEDQINTIFLKD